MTADPTTADLYRTIMAVEPPEAATPFEKASQDFVINEVWR
ncbi:hypothetical protein [Parafrankia sp. EAN1pec]